MLDVAEVLSSCYDLTTFWFLSSMTPREVIRVLVKDKDCPERVGHQESFWDDLRQTWEKEGLPHEGRMQELLDLDIIPINEEWTSTDAWVGHKRLVAETETTYVEENGWGAHMRYWKGKSGTPEHLSFALTDERVWREKYRDLLTGFDIRRFGDLGKLRSRYRELETSDKFRVYEVLQIFEIMRRSMGDVVMLESMCLNPGWINDFCSVLTDNIIAHLDYEIREVGRPDGIWFYEDLGYRQLPFVSPQMYRDLLLPHHRRFVQFCHSYELPVIMHTCGNIAPLFPHLLETGIDCLQPIEAKTGQNFVDLFNSAPRRIAYMGNMDIRAFETNDSDALAAEILPKLRAVREQRIPYIFHSDHSIPCTVRLSTYRHARAMVDEHGRY